MSIPLISITSVAGDSSATPRVSPPGGWPVQGEVRVSGANVTLTSMTYQIEDGAEKEVSPCPSPPVDTTVLYVFLLEQGDLTANGIFKLRVHAYDSSGDHQVVQKSLDCSGFSTSPPPVRV